MTRPSPIRVLVADEDHRSQYLLKIFCRDRPEIALDFVVDGQEALARIEHEPIDILISDIRMRTESGDDLLSAVKLRYGKLPVIIMTPHGSLEGEVDYLHRGADDYLTKPMTKEVFSHRLDRVIQRVSLTKEIERLREVETGVRVSVLIGQSPAMTELKAQLPTLAQTDASVVIYGESGTGKEVVARAIHDLSKRADRPFVTVNCAALPEALLESELFGHRRGAFTDAHADTPGLVDAAHTGTLFLDEIGEIPLGVQVKLLRFLESKEYKPLGAPESKIADIRVIAATNRNLTKAVEDGLFREDLYYRLNIVPVLLPPLKERAGDIALLTNHFLERFNAQMNKNVSLSLACFNRLERYAWPGNVRELEHKIEQLVVMSTDGVVRPELLQLNPQRPRRRDSESGPIGTFRQEKATVLRQFERNYLVRVLREESGHLTRAAKRAGLDRKNLWQLMKRHNIIADHYKSPR